MSQELFRVSTASPETLDLLVAYGAAGVLGMLAFVGFLVWRGKRAGAGKPPVRSRGSRGSKSRKR
jgi:hypothetical protein